MCKHHKTDPTAFSVASSFTSLSQRPYTPLGHKQFNVSSSGIKNRAKRVISFQAANRRAQRLFLLTSPPKPANYGLTRIIQPNLSEHVLLSCPLRDVTHTRQLIVRVGTCITVTFLPRRRHCRSINQRRLPSDARHTFFRINDNRCGTGSRVNGICSTPNSFLFRINDNRCGTGSRVSGICSTSHSFGRLALLVEAILDHRLFSARRYRCWLLLRDFLLVSPDRTWQPNLPLTFLEQYLASSVTSMTSTFNHPQCTPKTKFHAYWAQNQIYLQIE